MKSIYKIFEKKVYNWLGKHAVVDIELFKKYFETRREFLKQVDSTRKYKYKEDKKKIANKYGFETFLEAVVYIYWTEGSDAAEKKMEISRATVNSLMRISKFPMRPAGGCYHTQHDISGQQFGSWTVLYRAVDYEVAHRKRAAYYMCRCVCGNEKPVYAGSLRRGKSTGCGCIRHNI